MKKKIYYEAKLIIILLIILAIIFLISFIIFKSNKKNIEKNNFVNNSEIMFETINKVSNLPSREFSKIEDQKTINKINK